MQKCLSKLVNDVRFSFILDEVADFRVMTGNQVSVDEHCLAPKVFTQNKPVMKTAKTSYLSSMSLSIQQ